MAKLPAFALTQALSADFYFPAWYKYYSAQLGAENLFLITDRASKPAFSRFDLGGVYAYPSLTYDEVDRINMVAGLVEGMLAFYEAAIVADTDEFLVPDPRRYSGIHDFLEKTKCLYSTAIGVDVVQGVDEPAINVDRPILHGQRRLGYLTSSLCKTALTRIPLKWGVGYHYCNVYPSLGETFLLHMKRADLELQYKWLERMSTFHIPSDSIRNYYNPERSKIENFYTMVRGWKVQEGWEHVDDPEFRKAFLQEVGLERGGIYRGKHFSLKTLFVLPEEFRDIL